MNIKQVYTKIKELSEVYSKRDDLRIFCKLHFDEIISTLPRRVLDSDGADILNCIFNGFPDAPAAEASQKMKIRVVEAVLQVMRRECTSSTHCRDVTSRVCLEFPRMPVESLLKWCGDSVQSIVDNKDVNMIWRDILPECLNALSTYDIIKHCGTDLTVTEYQQQCVHTLCQCQWKDDQLVQLAAMFKDMQLSREDHKQVVNKICSYITDLTPDSLPPLVHQLLKLCKVYNLEIVLAHLTHYFNVHLYNKLEPPPQDSESTTIDIDDIVQHSSTEVLGSLSTCLYHVTRSAADPQLIRKHIKLWPRGQLLRSPFVINLALALSDKGSDFKSVCLDAIKSSIELRLLSDLRSAESASVRLVLPPDIQPATVLKVITADSASHRDLTVPSLLQLAFLLLSVHKWKPTSSGCWSLGKLVLLRLCKAQPEVAGHVLTQLNDKLLADMQPQYADCLYILCKLSPVSIARCTQLCSILECTQPHGGWRLAAGVYHAVHPLLNFSTATRDSLLMICRKGLYSRDPDHRCLALSGFLTILQHIKLSKTTFSSSQSNSEQYSSYSYLTQMTVDLHATQQGAVVTSRVRNEATCMEVVSILRRCLAQDAAVKQLLYTNIYECAKEKSMLHESILELLYEHLVKYLPKGDEDTSQLKFDKCVQVTSTSAVLIEPIAHLIFCISQFLQASDEEDLEDILSSQAVDTSCAYLKNKLNSIMDKLCSSEELAKIYMDDPGLTDITPESKSKALKVQLILQCYEALIAHLVMQWNVNNTNANGVYKIFKAYNQLLEQTKTLPKQGKKTNKSLDETRETNKTQKSQKSQPDKGKGPLKLTNLVKDRVGPFKPLPCVWGLRFCYRFLDLLYSSDVQWSTIEQRNSLRSRRDLHHFVLRCVHCVLTDEHMEKRMAASYVVKIAALMYSRFICRFKDVCEFDDQTALSCMEVFKQCLAVVLSPKYSLKMDVVMQNITDIPESSSSDCIASILEHLHSALTHIESDSNEEESDVLVRKLYTATLQCTGQLLEVQVSPCDRLSAVVIKLEEYVNSSKLECLPLVQSLLIAGAREQLETKFLDDILKKLNELLPRNTDEEPSLESPSSPYLCVSPRTSQTALIMICAHIMYRSRSVEHLLDVCKSVQTNVCVTDAAKTRMEKELTDMHKSLTIQLCQLTAWASSLARLRCTVGAASDKLLQISTRVYQLVDMFAKRIPPENVLKVRFDRLVKLCGKRFSSAIDDLIMFIEGGQEPGTASRVLRDTKMIPRLVLAGEQCTRSLLMLADKAKVNFQQYLSLGTARDFRIKAPVLQQVLHARENDAAGNNSEAEETINDADTVVLSPQGDDEGNPSKKKRRRVS